VSNVFLKVSDSFRDRYEFARTHIKRETVLSQLALINIMLIAILLRFKPAFEFQWVINANDPYSQLIAAAFIDSQIDQVGFISAILNFFTFVDPSMWYPNPGVRVFGATQNLGTPMTAVLIRRFLLLFGINMPISDAAFLAPAVLGSLTVLMIYFLGKEIANKRVGLFAAFFLSFSPGHLQRTMAGFFDNEAVGVFLMILAFYLFLRALRTGSLLVSFFSGISLGLLLLSWGGATYAVQLIALYTVVLVLTKKYSLRLLTAYAGTIITGLSLAVLYPRSGPSILLDIDGLVPLGVLGILLVFSFYNNYKDKINNYPFLTGRNLEIGGYSVVFGGLGFIILNFFIPIIPTFRAKFITVVVPFFRDNSPILKSVAEHLIVTWGSLFRNLFLLVFLIPIAVIYLYKKPTENNIFLLLFLLTSLYFSGSMVRLILILAPAAALGGAKAIEEILLPYAMVRQEKFFLSKRKRSVSVSIGTEHVGVAFIVIFAVLGFNLLQGLTISNQIIQPSSVSQSYKTPTGIVDYGDWFETFDWIKRETPTTSVLASWWDYGYWLTLANRTIVVDNATLNSTQIGNIGALMMSSPDYALKIASYYDIDYVIVLLAAGQTGLDNDIGKIQWMIKIAEASGNLDKDLNNPILSKNFFKYAPDQVSIQGYDKDFFKSLIWAIMTDGVDESVLNGFKGNAIVKDTLPGYTTGFAPGYEIYRQIFVESHMSANKFVRVMKIDWDAAERLVGVSR
jgi:dolichyl-diphosphooligosaccharide--protein glycosyltransferase